MAVYNRIAILAKNSSAIIWKQHCATAVARLGVTFAHIIHSSIQSYPTRGGSLGGQALGLTYYCEIQ